MTILVHTMLYILTRLALGTGNVYGGKVTFTEAARQSRNLHRVENNFL